MHKPGFVFLNEMHKILCDFEIKRVTYSRPEDQYQEKRICHLVGFAIPKGYREHEKNWQILGPCQRTKNIVEYEGDGDTNCICYPWNE